MLGLDDGPLVFRPGAVSGTPRYDDPVTAPRRWAVDPLLPILAIAVAVGLIACGRSVPATPKPSTAALPSAAPSAELTAVPGGPSITTNGASAGPPTTTETEFGEIFDALPASFPKLPGQEPAETGDGPVSGSFAVNMGADDAALAMAAALTRLGWTADVTSPLEDGTVVLDATHAPAGCRTEVRFTPRSGTVIMSVLYGASCPFS